MDPAERDPMMLEEKPVFPTGKGWVFEIRGTTWYDFEAITGKEFLRETLLANLQAAAKSKNADPAIQGKVSHIFLYNTWRDETPRPDNFETIKVSLIDFLMPTTASAVGPDGKPIVAPPAGGAPTTGLAPGTPPANAIQWKPLVESFVGSQSQQSGGFSGGFTPTSASGVADSNNPYHRPPKKADDPTAPRLM